MELANCVRCGEVFAKGLRNICKKCYQEEEDAFNKVYKFLTVRKNRQATILEIVDATDVDEDLIIKFIKEKRLRSSDFPNLTYACDRCGNPILEGKLCGSCREQILTDMDVHDQLEEKAEAARAAEKTKSVYYAVDKDRKN